MRSAAPTEWRPVASAPKDGTRIIVTIRSTEQGPACVDTVFWSRETTRNEHGWRAADSSADCVILYHDAEVAGWMPMPTPLVRSSWPEPMSPEEAEEIGGSGI